jgi:GT2 family glycosyltransferase
MSAIQFSVVIPTCRRVDLLERCLESIQPKTQSLEPSRYEVVVTDDDPAQSAKARLGTRLPWVRWVRGPARGPAANRNHGARQATGEWLCFLDDDCIASPQWLTALAAAVNPSLDMIEGRTETTPMRDTPFEHVVFNHNGGAYLSCNLAVRRERFLALGGFDEDFLEAASEDTEFAHRFHAHGFHSIFCPEAVVTHPVRPAGWRGIWKRLLLVRWESLYHYKVDEQLHLADSVPKNLLSAFADAILNLLRLTRDAFRRWNSAYWKSHSFWLVTRWATFPVILLYTLYWTARYHAELNARKKPAAR